MKRSNKTVKLQHEIEDGKDKSYDFGSIYLNTTEISGLILSDSKRLLVKIKFQNKSIIRKIRGYNKLTKDEVLLDYTSARELGVEKGNEVVIQKANFMESCVTYLIKHPKEEIRFSYYFFLITLVLAISSIVLTILNIPH